MIRLLKAAAVIQLSSVAVLSTPVRAQQPIPSWRVIADAPVGEDRPFTRILAILPASDGSVVIADDRNHQISVFGKNGAYSHDIGRVGRGPGEFERVRSAGLLGDTLWVIDGSQPRTSFFSLEGEFLRSVRNESGLWLTALVPDGGLTLVTSPAGSATMGREPRIPLVLMTRTGQHGDTIGWVPGKNRMLVLGPASDGSYLINTQLFSDAGLTIAGAGSPSFFIVDRSVAPAGSSSATFSVAGFRSDGDTLWHRRYRYTPRPLEETRADSLWNAMEPPLSRAGFSQSEIRDALFIPEYYPPTASGFAAADGTLWLRREPGASEVDYLVIGADGSLLARVAVPSHVTLMAAAASYAWGVQKDEYDVPTVIRYRIER